MSINLLIGEGRGNRIMVGQNHCRTPLSAAEFIPPGSLPAAMVELRSMILSPYDSVAHRGLSRVRAPAMSINLLIGEGRGNRIMVGQSYCRNPFISCRVH